VQGSNETVLLQLYSNLPQTILEIKNDTIRTELLNKLDEVLNKAIEDKNVTVITYALKELHLLYREYSN
jgi:hypothetical protein